MSNTFESIFGADEDTPEVTVQTYPGSTKRIRWKDPSTGIDRANVLPASDPIFKKESWGKPTAIEVVPEHVFLFYRPNILAKIMRKSSPTIKFWEQRGFIPKPPFRFRFDSTVRNYYNEEVIVAFLRLLNERGQLTEDRIDWARFPDLPDLIRKEWERIRDEWLAEVNKLR